MRRAVLQSVKAGQVHWGFEQMEENSWSPGNAWHAFIRGWDNPRCQKLPVTQQDIPIPLYTKGTQSWQGAKILYTTAWFCACGPIQGHGNTVYPAQSQGYGNTAYLSCPDIWVREPDCLCFPYYIYIVASEKCPAIVNITRTVCMTLM